VVGDLSEEVEDWLMERVSASEEFLPDVTLAVVLSFRVKIPIVANFSTNRMWMWMWMWMDDLFRRFLRWEEWEEWERVLIVSGMLLRCVVVRFDDAGH